MLLLISIIIPAFNAERYLSACLDSIIHQSNKSIEIIIVNDGSTDSTSVISDSYALNYNFIKVIHQSNQGVFLSRIKGLMIAKGEYIFYIDADDLIIKDTINRLVNTIEIKKYDIIFFGIKLKGSKSLLKTKPYTPNINQKSNILKSMFLDKKSLSGYIAGKLIKKSVALQAVNIIDYEHDKLELYEDCLFLFCVSIYCKEAVTIPCNMYVYRIHKESATQKLTTPYKKIKKLEKSRFCFKKLETAPVIKNNRYSLDALEKINKTIDSSIFIQKAKEEKYIKNIYNAWRLDSRSVNLARIIIYIATFSRVKK